jgi:hypothetical protein
MNCPQAHELGPGQAKLRNQPTALKIHESVNAPQRAQHFFLDSASHVHPMFSM